MMKANIIKEGNVSLPKDIKQLTVTEFYFIRDYLEQITLNFAGVFKKNKVKRAIKRKKCKK